MSLTENRRFQSFREFWPYYVGEHRKPLCRAIHYVAAVCVLAVVAVALARGPWYWLLLTPVAGYGPAWLAHVWVEHNRPATWSYVWWSLVAEFKMFGLALAGRMRDEVARLYGCADPEPDAPLLAED